MKVVENDIIPFKGFLAINLFGVAFVRRKPTGASALRWRRTPTRAMKSTL